MRSIFSRGSRRGAVLAVGSLVAGLLVALPGTAAGQTGTDVTVLTFNDFHGRISTAFPSTVAFADTIEKLRKEHPGAALTAAGDSLGASLYASSFKQDQPTIDVLNALGVQASALGNHEFDKGIDDLQGRIEDAVDFPYLGANVTVNGEPMQGYEIIDVNGIKVGVVGVVTASTKSLVSPDGIVGVEFGDPVDAVNKVADQLKDGDPANGEADIVVASYHEGAAVQSSLEEAEAETEIFNRIVNDTDDNVSAIFNGHTHLTYNWTKNNRPIIQTGSYAANIGSVTFTVDPDTKEITNVTSALTKVPTDASGADMSDPVTAEVKRIVDDTLAEAETVGNTPVGAVDADITTALDPQTGARDDRLSESALGNLVADYMVEAVEDRGGAQIAFMNPGGLRADLENDPAYTTGEKNITQAEANAVLPFANTLVTMEMTGAQIKTVLEQQWQPDGESRPFLALGTSKGFTWTFDPSRDRGDHITGIFLNGEPIDPAQTYKVATQSFLGAGGDNFLEFANATNKQDSGLIDSDTWMAYLESHDVLSPDNAKHAVIATGVPEEITAGTPETFTLSDINLTSRDAKLATSGEVTINVDTATGGSLQNIFSSSESTPGSQPAGTVEVSQDVTTDSNFPTNLDGSATVTVNLPESTPSGDYILKVAFDNGTEAYVPVAVAGTDNQGGGSLENLPAAGGLLAVVGGLGLLAAVAAGAQFIMANGMIPPALLSMLPKPIRDMLHI